MQAQQLRTDYPVNNGLAPEGEPRVFTYLVPITANQWSDIDLTLTEELGYLENAQTMMIDNTTGAAPLEINFPFTEHTHVIPAYSEAILPVLIGTPQIRFRRGTSGNVRFHLLNVPLPAVVWSVRETTVGPNTTTQSNVAASASSATLLASSPTRRSATVYNDSTATLYLLLGLGVASAANFSVVLVPGAYYEVPAGFTGALVGVWTAATGAARITEMF